jgi:hypothetical protein
VVIVKYKFLNFHNPKMFTHFEQLGYLDFYTLIKLSVTLPHGVCKITTKF